MTTLIKTTTFFLLLFCKRGLAIIFLFILGLNFFFFSFSLKAKQRQISRISRITSEHSSDFENEGHPVANECEIARVVRVVRFEIGVAIRIDDSNVEKKRGYLGQLMEMVR